MSDWRRWRWSVLLFAPVALWGALSRSGSPAVRVAAVAFTPLAVPVARQRRASVAVVEEKSALVELGRAIFFDSNLSEPRGTSCASCHDPERAFSGSNGSTIGVPRGSRATRFARRASPSVLYLKYVPKFGFR